MKVKTSITLSRGLLDEIEQYSTEFQSRSEFLELAAWRFLQHLSRVEIDKRDLRIIDRRSDALSAEAEDILGYQVLP